ncbi:MAG: glycogen synthase [Myxococcota bacterium]|nr:glycogen synthase [Myxococcota bacterium]
MKVLFLTAEAAPFTKVGGLGDVAGSLPRALRALPSAPDVRVVTPLHGGARARIPTPLERVATVSVPHPAGTITGEVLATTQHGVPFYFVESPALFEDDVDVYHLDTGWDGHRYAFFSLAALALARAIDFVPDVVHANDWHTSAAIPAIHRARFSDPALGRTKTVLTVHNLPYVGFAAGPAMRAFGLVPGELPLVPPGAREMPLPIGLALADRITTVSPGYAREILEPEFGAGLDALLRARRSVLSGILNGLDVELWDPATDAALASPFDVERPEGRAADKAALERALAFPEQPDLPVLGVVSRLTQQKGIDLVPDALRMLAREHAFRCVLLGTGDTELEESLLRLAGELGDRVRVRVGFDDALSRRIYAGADLLLLPSRYEPCGLAQMIAMRYGCIPVARDTGGLSDTVRDLDLHDEPTGFLFPVASSRSLAFGLRRALATHRQPYRFRMLQKNGMRQDFTWARAASEYARLYSELVTGVPRT